VNEYCAFCDIVSGATPASIVYEDDLVAAFLDLFPVNPGHTLVIPKRHIADLQACPSDVAGEVFECAQRLALAIVQATGATGFNVWTANGADAGQEIFHLHVHVLPRFPDDEFGLRFPKGYPLESSRVALDGIATTIRRRL
jgi:histidine triad (HIT) family protein